MSHPFLTVLSSNVLQLCASFCSFEPLMSKDPAASSYMAVPFAQLCK